MPNTENMETELIRFSSSPMYGKFIDMDQAGKRKDGVHEVTQNQVGEDEGAADYHRNLKDDGEHLANQSGVYKLHRRGVKKDLYQHQCKQNIASRLIPRPIT